MNLYGKLWQKPFVGEELTFVQEPDNIHEYAVAVTTNLPSKLISGTIGHVPVCRGMCFLPCSVGVFLK